MSDPERSPVPEPKEEDAMTTHAEPTPQDDDQEISKKEASAALDNMFDDKGSDDDQKTRETANDHDAEDDDDEEDEEDGASPARRRSPPEDEDDARSASSDGDMGRGGDSRHDNHRLEYEEEEEGVPLKREVVDAHIQLPDVPKLKGTDGQTWILRLPKGIGAGAEPYEPQLYKEAEGPIQEAEDEKLTKQQERRRKALERMHDVANTIRWKWVDGSGGVPERKSNSRIVRWSDGSASLQVGQEIWDIDLPAGNPSKPFSTKEEQHKLQGITTSAAAHPKAKADGSLSVLYGTEFDEKVLFADRVVNGYLGLIPATPNIRNHQKRLQALSGEAVKQAKIRSYHDTSGIAPDKKAEMEVKRIQEQQRRALVEKGVRYTGAMTSWRPGAAVVGSRGSSPRKRDRAGPSGGGGGAGRAGRGGDMSSEEEYEMDPRPGAKYRGGGGGYEVDDFVVEDEVEDDDDFLTGGDRPKKKSKSEKTKRSRDFSDDDEGENEDEEDEAEAEESEGEASELEAAERAAERAEAKRQKAKEERRVRDAPTATIPDDVSDQEMASVAPAKKRTVVVDDEEE